MLSPADWQFLASGSANEVFIPKEVGEYDGKVLRLRKKGSTISTLEIYDYLQSPKLDRLRKYMPTTELIDLTPDVVRQLSPTADDTDPHGILLDNVYADRFDKYDTIVLNKYLVFHVGTDETILEFKPKWLYDPPSDAKACRNCAQAVAKNQQFIDCPLLLRQGPDGIEQWCLNIQDGLGSRLDVYNKLLKAVSANTDLIQILYTIQNEDDTDLASLRSEDDVTESLRLSMTLKDVTIFLNLDTGGALVVDFDKKPTSKWEQWSKQEQKLKDIQCSGCAL